MAEYYQREDGTRIEIPSSVVSAGREAVGAFVAQVDASSDAPALLFTASDAPPVDEETE